MKGWIIPPPAVPTKGKQDLINERHQKVKKLIERGYLKSARIREAMLKVPREDFIPYHYRDYAYFEVPLPLPGEKATISCPHSYPLFYEPLGLDQGQSFLEVGLGSGYGTALAREVVGPEGLVVSVEIDPLTFEYAQNNLLRNGYDDIILVQGDGSFGYMHHAPYDRICITAACPAIPEALLAQLNFDGKLIAPVMEHGVQNLVLLENTHKGLRKRLICEVLYVPLQGLYGTTDPTPRR